MHGKIKDIVKTMLTEFQEAIKMVMSQIGNANVMCILWPIKDPTCMVLRPATEEIEYHLEEMMPEQDILHGDTMAGMVSNIKLLNYDQKDMIGELFNDLEVAHKKMACVCERMSTLTKTLTPIQLMVVLKATIRPMIQLDMMARFLDTQMESKEKVDLPKDGVKGWN